MEVLEVSSYIHEKRAMIAKKYLGPQAKEASGLGGTDALIEWEAIDVLIKWYCRKRRVQNLKKYIDRVGGVG